LNWFPHYRGLKTGSVDFINVVNGVNEIYAVNAINVINIENDRVGETCQSVFAGKCFPQFPQASGS